MAEERVQRRLAAIISADVVGYSRLMGQDEAGTLARMKALRADFLHPKIAEYGGRIVKTTGDGTLIEFASAVDAVSHAVNVQQGMVERNDGVPEAHRIRLRFGINLGDIIIDGEEIYGDGVNVAARLEALAGPGEVVVSGLVYQAVRGKLDVAFDDLGPQRVKNIAEPVQCYRVGAPHPDGQPARAPVAATLPIPEKPSIAILPFVNMSGDEEQEYFSDGITEDIITALSHIRQLFVIARNSSFTYKGRAVDVQAVARDLGVRYVLEGSVRKAGNRVRVSAQLIAGESGNHLWAERYDRNLEDIFAVQDEITETVVGSLAPELDRSERERALQKSPGDLDAWELYQKGLWHVYRFTREDTAVALDLFEQSARVNPRFGPAHAGISFAHYTNVFLDHSEDRESEIAETYEAARRAVACDEKDSGAHWVLARAHHQRREFGPAIAEFEASIRLNPSNAQGYYMLGSSQILIGEAETALQNMERAMRLSPHDPLAFAMMAVRSNALLLLGRLDEAVAWMERSMRQPNAHALAFANGCFIAALAGRDDVVEMASANLRRLRPDYTCADFLRAVPFKKAEHRQLALDGFRKAGIPEK